MKSTSLELKMHKFIKPRKIGVGHTDFLCACVTAYASGQMVVGSFCPLGSHFYKKI